MIHYRHNNSPTLDPTSWDSPHPLIFFPLYSSTFTVQTASSALQRVFSKGSRHAASQSQHISRSVAIRDVTKKSSTFLRNIGSI